MIVKVYHNGSRRFFEPTEVLYGNASLKYKDNDIDYIEYGINKEKHLIPERYCLDMDWDVLMEEKPIRCFFITLIYRTANEHKINKYSETIVFNQPEDIDISEINRSRIYLMENGRTIERVM